MREAPREGVFKHGLRDATDFSLSAFLDQYFRLLKGAVVLLLGVMLVPVTLQIVSRYTGWIPKYIWTEEVARFCFVWLIMLGSVIAVRDGSHFEVDLLPVPDDPRKAARGRLLVSVLMLVLALAFAWFGIEFTRFGAVQHSEMSGINMASIYASFPVAGLSWCLFLLEKISGDLEVLLTEADK